MILRALLALLLAAGAAAVGSTASAAPAAAHPCATATTACTGTVDVPLNWADPASERIAVTFLRIPRTAVAQPATGTILVHMGGPSPSIRSTEKVVEHLGPAMEHQDVVLADLRGMGRSAPIGCTGLDMDEPATAGPCTAQLGPRGAFFGTDQATNDYDAVRAALGIERWTLFGNSYGTELMQAYAARFPQRVAAVLLTGVVPATADGYIMTGGPYDSIQASIAHLDDACRASPTCATLAGTTRERLTAVVADLRATGPADDLRKLVAVLENGVFDAGPRRDVNAALDAHLGGDRAPLRRLLDAVPPRRDRPVLPAERAATLITMQCSDAHLPYDRAASVADRQAQLAAFYERERPFAPFTPAEGNAGSGLANTAEFCLHSTVLRDSAFIDVAAPHPDVPMLEIQGTADSLHTLEPGAVAARFPGGTSIEVPYARHGSWTVDHPIAGFCQRAMMQAFLTAPRTPAVDHHCDLTAYQLHGSFPRTAADLPAVDGLAPAESAQLAAAFAAAVDALTPLYPIDAPAPTEFRHAGLRGGTATLAAGVVTLAGVRYVDDVTVDGTVTIDARYQSTATLTLTGGHRVTLRWAMLDPAVEIPVSGTLDGRAFDARVRAF